MTRKPVIVAILGVALAVFAAAVWYASRPAP